jgi:hypothetical protein
MKKVAYMLQDSASVFLHFFFWAVYKSIQCYKGLKVWNVSFSKVLDGD